MTPYRAIAVVILAAATIFGTGPGPAVGAAPTRAGLAVANHRPAESLDAELAGPVPFGAVADDRAGSGDGSPTLSAPVQEPDGGGISSASLGLASWYNDGPGLYAAVPGWHWGDTPYKLRVCHDHKCVTVTVRDACGCPGDRLIDLSRDAFRRLAPLSVGVIVVTVTGGAAAGPLPATDTP